MEPPHQRRQPGLLPVGYDSNSGLAIFYRSDRAKADLIHAKLKHQYFVPSIVILCALSLALRIVTLFIALAHGALFLTEIMAAFVWVEPVIIYLVWLQWYAGLWAAFWLSLISLLFKGLYLIGYFVKYWGVIDSTWFWIVAGLLIAFCVVSLKLLASTVNVLLGKMHHCVTFNDLDVLSKEVKRNFGDTEHQPPPPPLSQPSPPIYAPAPVSTTPAAPLSFSLDPISGRKND